MIPRSGSASSGAKAAAEARGARPAVADYFETVPLDIGIGADGRHWGPGSPLLMPSVPQSDLIVDDLRDWQREPPRGASPSGASAGIQRLIAGDFGGVEHLGDGQSGARETLSQAVDACVQSGDTDRALSLLLLAVSRRVEPATSTLGAVCKSLAAQGRAREIQSVMSALEAHGFRLGESIFASLIYACGVAQPPELERAERAFVDIVSRGLRPQRMERVFKHVLGSKRTRQLLSELALAPPSEVVSTSASQPRRSQASEGTQPTAGVGAVAADGAVPGVGTHAAKLNYVPGAILIHTAAFPPLDRIGERAIAQHDDC